MTSKKLSISPLFPRPLLGLRCPKGWEATASFLLPETTFTWGDIPAGGFGHCGNMENCKCQDENGENTSKWIISPVFHILCWKLGSQRGGRHWPVIILPEG